VRGDDGRIPHARTATPVARQVGASFGTAVLAFVPTRQLEVHPASRAGPPPPRPRQRCSTSTSCRSSAWPALACQSCCGSSSGGHCAGAARRRRRADRRARTGPVEARRRTPAGHLRALWPLGLVVMMTVWALVLFGPSATAAHQGTYYIEPVPLGVMGFWYVSRGSRSSCPGRAWHPAAQPIDKSGDQPSGESVGASPQLSTGLRLEHVPLGVGNRAHGRREARSVCGECAVLGAGRQVPAGD
jgi:hypothetical protein